MLNLLSKPMNLLFSIKQAMVVLKQLVLLFRDRTQLIKGYIQLQQAATEVDKLAAQLDMYAFSNALSVSGQSMFQYFFCFLRYGMHCYSHVTSYPYFSLFVSCELTATELANCSRKRMQCRLCQFDYQFIVSNVIHSSP